MAEYVMVMTKGDDEPNAPWSLGFECIGANHLGEYAYFNAPSYLAAIRGMANFLFNFPFENYANNPYWPKGELFIELHQRDNRVAKIWYAPEPGSIQYFMSGWW